MGRMSFNSVLRRQACSMWSWYMYVFAHPLMLGSSDCRRSRRGSHRSGSAHGVSPLPLGLGEPERLYITLHTRHKSSNTARAV